MPSYKGIIDTVFVKEYDKPKSFEYQGKTITNTLRISLKMDNGKWYGLGDSNSGKPGEIFVKAGLLTAGAEIEFMYTSSDDGKFHNIKKATVALLKEGPPNTVSLGVQNNPQKGTDSTQKGDYVNQSAVGQCVNVSIDLLKYTKEDLLNPAKARDAITFYKDVFVNYNGVWNDDAEENKAQTEQPTLEDLNEIGEQGIPF